MPSTDPGEHGGGAVADPVAELAEQLPREVHVYDVGGERLFVRDAEHGVECFRKAGATSDRGALVAHDGPVVIDGTFRYIRETEYGAVETYHPHGGRMGRLDTEASTPEAVLLAEVERRA